MKIEIVLEYYKTNGDIRLEAWVLKETIKKQVNGI